MTSRRLSASAYGGVVQGEPTSYGRLRLRRPATTPRAAFLLHGRDRLSRVAGAARIEEAASVVLPDGVPPAVVLRGVAVDVRRTPVLRNLDLRIDAGEVVGIVGANGSGKTTLLTLVATLLRPAAGTAHILGADLRGRIRGELRRSICLVGHQSALHPRLSLAENLRFMAAVSGQAARVADAALDLVGLARAADRRAESCSHGMIHRADLARALLGRPKLLLLDEPHAGLDQGAIELVDFLVTGARDRGGAVLVASHDRPRLDPLADKVLELVDGQLVQPVGSQ